MLGELINELYTKVETLEDLRNKPIDATDPSEKVELYNSKRIKLFQQLGELSEYEKILGSDFRVNSGYLPYVWKHKLVDSFGQLTYLVEDIANDAKLYSNTEHLPGIDTARAAADQMYGERKTILE